ncbi:sugar ABC transporter substrate-binding protein [Marinitenerispora sediminis]|uniref:Sugar ABC transporter substrate-binding protein n=1 Tax=Marinitenerispora sediminis TaxID=1931232 RepID=A0A368T1Q0_9ACTN|nr:sugar ABC transporter substrate-binding protein [Marinitenerispora sediminis]RCV50180.1 sugar ABC transporter substrate-binding protein [Marinitenerispora sediminis]RCV54533.1 sugar ABC transporter substrate-binding protein [Marinitenerispora sediminis]RCV56952.1 sugar ABC transporter substrate-binding protein [Marinitenerispora sediminis]
MGRKHVLPAVALGVAVTLAATACGTGGPSGAGQTLDVWIMEGTHPDATAFFDEVAAEFEATTGAQVNVEFVPWADAHDNFVTAIAGGTAPDVAEVGTTWTPEFADAGALADVTERAGDTSDYVPGLLEAGTLDDRLYGVPWFAGVRAVVYRTDVFEELELEEPTTWEELREVATTIQEEREDMAGFPVPGGAMFSALPFVWGAGGDVAVQAEDGTWQAEIDSPESREGIRFFTDLALEDGLSTTGATTWLETDMQDAFIRGDSAMMIAGSWAPAAIMETDPELEGRVGAFPIPGRDGGYSPSFLGGSHLSVFNGSEDEELAWQYVQLLTGDEFARRWTEETSYFPGRQSQLAPFTESEDPLVSPFAIQMSEAGHGVPVTSAWGQVEGQRVVQTMVQAILSGDASVEEATATAAESIEETLNGGA